MILLRERILRKSAEVAEVGFKSLILYAEVGVAEVVVKFYPKGNGYGALSTASRPFPLGLGGTK